MPEKGTMYPRQLSETELSYLRFLLPENKDIYNEYYKTISVLWVIGHGRFGNENLVLGEKDSQNSHHSGMGSIFAAGIYIEGDLRTDLLLHFMVEGRVEFDIIKQPSKPEDTAYTLSNWSPKVQFPARKVKIREMQLVPNELSLACDAEKKQFWIHEYKTQFNRIIPATNLLNEIRFVAGLKGDMKPKEIFEILPLIGDDVIVKAFIKYNKLFKKVEQTDIKIPAPLQQKKSIMERIFKGS